MVQSGSKVAALNTPVPPRSHKYASYSLALYTFGQRKPALQFFEFHGISLKDDFIYIWKYALQQYCTYGIDYDRREHTPDLIYHWWGVGMYVLSHVTTSRVRSILYGVHLDSAFVLCT